MASNLFNTSSMLIIIFCFILLISFVPSTTTASKIKAKHPHDNDIQHTICSKTTNPNACLNLRHVKASNTFKDIAKTSTIEALNAAKGIHKKLNALTQKPGKDKIMYTSLLQCSKNYNDVIRDLTIANRSFGSSAKSIKNINSVIVQTTDAQQEVEACQAGFHEMGKSGIPTDLKLINGQISLLLEVVKIGSQAILKK